MAFTKAEMQEQLAPFIQGFASSVDRMLSTHIADEMESIERVQKSTLWGVSSALYDYGICGIALEGLGVGEVIDAEVADVELFLNLIECLDEYLAEDTSILPWRAKRAVQAAVARHVLEGGDRYFYREGGVDGYLTLAEITLLADMDERSVRNAASKKSDDSLKTETWNKRTMVSIEEARRWLSGRKGFVPTQISVATPKPSISVVSLPSETVARLEKKAAEAGLSIADYLERQLNL